MSKRSMANGTSALRSRLSTWHTELCRMRVMVGCNDRDGVHVDLEHRILWLEIAFGSPREAALSRVIEGFCLLNLLVRVDAEAWRREVLSLWNCSDLVAWIEADREQSYREPHSSLSPWRCGLNVATQEVPTLLPRDQSEDTSSDFKDTRAYLLGALHGHAAGDTDHHCEIPLRLSIPHMADVNVELAYALAFPHTQNLPSTPHIPRVVLHEVAFETLVGVTVNQRGLQLLDQISSHGIRVYQLPEVVIDKDLEHEHRILKPVRSLYRLSTTTTSISPLPIDSAPSVVDVNPNHATVLSATASALQDSLTVRDLEVNIDTDPYEEVSEVSASDDEAWMMLAYTVFSRHANHRIERLQLSLDFFEIESLQQVSQVIEHPDPMEDLFGSPPELRETFPAQIAARQFYLYDQTYSDRDRRLVGISDAEAKMVHESADPIRVRVIAGPSSTSSPWWNVLLPGWGEAWVRPEDVVTLRDDQLLRPRQSLPGFDCITLLKMSNDSMEASLGLIQLIGHETKELNVFEHTDDEPEYLDEWCHSVLRHCPQLKKLALWVAYNQNLQFLVDAAVNGDCRLDHLALARVCPEEASHITVLFDALCDPSHTLTKNIKTLSLGFNLPPDKGHWVVDPLLRLLQANSSLTSIVIAFGGSSSEHVDDVAIDRAMAEHLHEPVVVRTAPLELARKLAFFSVIASTSGDARVPQLDSLVVAKIFEFAAYGCTRLLRIKYRWKFVSRSLGVVLNEAEDVVDADENLHEDGDL